MNPYDNSPFDRESPYTENIPPQQSYSEPSQPDYSGYRNSGPVRRESPYANSPYEAQHQNTQPHQNPYTYQSPYEAPRPPKARKKRTGFWKKAVACILTIALVAGSCAVTATVVNNRWEARADLMENTFNRRIEQLQQQVDDTKNTHSAFAGSSAVAGGAMTPSQVYATNVASVVAISATVTANGYYGVSEGTSTGSGFILSEDGYVVTNFHVVEGATEVSVITHDGTEYGAEVLGGDESNDVAVLKLDTTGLPHVTVGSSDDLIIGDMVVAIGNPLGTLTSTQTVGYVSGKDRDVTTDGSIISMIQTDAAINSGNSGGPLFNMQGEVVGITTAKYSGTTGSGATIEGIGFAIPIDDVKGIIEDLVNYGYVTGAYMGVTVQNTDAESASMFGLPVGAYILDVEKGGAADKAGIQPKDIIIDLGGYEVTGITTLTRALRNFKAGDTTTVTLVRSGGQMELEITLDEKPQPQQEATVPQETVPSTQPPAEGFDPFRYFFGG